MIKATDIGFIVVVAALYWAVGHHIASQAIGAISVYAGLVQY